jgi:hypothetical protein
MTRDELTAATMRAHLDYKGDSWIADTEKRAIAVSEPGWQEICRLQQQLNQARPRARKSKP